MPLISISNGLLAKILLAPKIIGFERSLGKPIRKEPLAATSTPEKVLGEIKLSCSEGSSSSSGVGEILAVGLMDGNGVDLDAGVGSSEILGVGLTEKEGEEDGVGVGVGVTEGVGVGVIEGIGVGKENRFDSDTEAGVGVGVSSRLGPTSGPVVTKGSNDDVAAVIGSGVGVIIGAAENRESGELKGEEADAGASEGEGEVSGVGGPDGNGLSTIGSGEVVGNSAGVGAAVELIVGSLLEDPETDCCWSDSGV